AFILSQDQTLHRRILKIFMPIKMFLKGYISGVFVFVCFIHSSFRKRTNHERAVNYFSQYINELFL
ncbi:MAG TPA: hypothetical protein DHV98_02200, partial [Flavobacteriaceae bacterium]|nr:hypothetical protein [Flavobacteriaceae bacterium]